MKCSPWLGVVACEAIAYLSINCGGVDSGINPAPIPASDAAVDTSASHGGTGAAPGSGGSFGASAGAAGSAGSGGSDDPPVYGAEGPSCAGGLQCSGMSCCQSILVPGGTFPMGCCCVDDCFVGEPWGLPAAPEHAATVSSFFLDTFEVTVGRFRAFVNSYNGTPPAHGAGAHPLIADSGWQSAWDYNLPYTQAELVANLKCSPNLNTWTDTPGANEDMAINCVSWYETFAFCAWDGGRLPTEAEWEFAAAGGDQNRWYAWGNQSPGPALANYRDSDNSPFIAVGSHPLGAGRWYHQDLSGGMWEWVFDACDNFWYDGAGSTCTDCANMVGGGNVRGFRGGSWSARGGYMTAAFRNGSYPVARSVAIGFRCVHGSKSPDGGVGGAGGSIGDGGNDASTNDSGASGCVVPPPANCPSTSGGPAMVAVCGGYCIDSTEVTRDQYAAWIAANPETTGQPVACAWNTDYHPDAGCMGGENVCKGSECGNHPQVCVDWCDAYAYCRAVGKRLCGKIGGGAISYGEDDNASLDQWYNACSSGGALNYPYGGNPAISLADGYHPHLCNGSGGMTPCCVESGTTVQVGSLAGCQSSAPGYSGTWDLSGNVFEWEDYCGEPDHCQFRGGSFRRALQGLQCTAGDSRQHKYVAEDIGFRCCAP